VTSPLENLRALGHLHAEPPDAKEFVADSEKRMNALESRFDLAYNAAHALCLAALRHAGYRSTNRYMVFQVLPHTLSVRPEVWRVIARSHDVRNRGEYEGDFYADERLLADLIAACKVVAAALDQLPALTGDR
jgi:hypothetical protein